MSEKINKNKEYKKRDSFLFKSEDLKIEEVSTTDIKIEEIDKIKSKNNSKGNVKSNSKKKVTFYPLIIVEEIESYKEYNKEIYKKNANERSDCSCACNII